MLRMCPHPQTGSKPLQSQASARQRAHMCIMEWELRGWRHHSQSTPGPTPGNGSRFGLSLAALPARSVDFTEEALSALSRARLTCIVTSPLRLRLTAVTSLNKRSAGATSATPSLGVRSRRPARSSVDQRLAHIAKSAQMHRRNWHVGGSEPGRASVRLERLSHALRMPRHGQCRLMVGSASRPSSIGRSSWRHSDSVPAAGHWRSAAVSACPAGDRCAQLYRMSVIGGHGTSPST